MEPGEIRLHLRARGIWQQSVGPDHPYLALSDQAHATLGREMGGWSEAEALYRKALAHREKNLGSAHPDLAETLDEYAALLRKVGRGGEADRLTARATGIRAHAR